MPCPPFPLWWSNVRPPRPSDQCTKLLVAIFNKHDCFSSIELHKTGQEMSHSDWKKTKQVFCCFYRSFMVDKSTSYSKMAVLETHDSERHQKWQEDVTKQVFCCCRDTINYQMPVPRDSSCIKCPGVALGDARSWNWLTHKNYTPPSPWSLALLYYCPNTSTAPAIAALPVAINVTPVGVVSLSG